jgi:transcriptional regulator
LTGKLELRPQEELQGILDRQTKFFEDQLLPKTPWTTEKMSEGVMERMMRAIVPCKMQVSGVDGTWKLNQNKPEDVRLRAADAVGENGMGTALAELADLMRVADGQR